MEQEIKDIIYEIEYGNLGCYIDNFNIELIKKVLCIYVNKTNNTYNKPYGFLDDIINEIKKIDLEEV